MKRRGFLARMLGTAALETEMKLKIAELTERLGLVERAFESYKQQPLDTVPEHFRRLQPLAGKAVIPPGAVQIVEVSPRSAEAAAPRYCKIEAVNEWTQNTRVHLHLGSVIIQGVDQMQTCDTSCEHYVSTRFYDLQYGAPVDWGCISHRSLAREMQVHLKNPHGFPVRVNIEVWCEIRTLYGLSAGISYPGVPRDWDKMK